MRSSTSSGLEPAAIPHLFIRPMDSVAEIDLVATYYRDAPDYWLLVEEVLPGRGKAERFFTDGPPGCDPAQSYRLGLFLEGRLSGLAELSFGFPEPQDAYLAHGAGALGAGGGLWSTVSSSCGGAGAGEGEGGCADLPCRRRG
ncbi:acetyltransferase domain-containing protein [Phaeobacter inhibens]|nr:acetyltransferase domain-containing protein [Phaeobacter inhibens]AUR07387.1 acetyltransferase domain-containing protein [Phaeobacter inhibens]